MSRDGVVFMRATAARDLHALVRDTGEVSAAVAAALLALED